MSEMVQPIDIQARRNKELEDGVRTAMTAFRDATYELQQAIDRVTEANQQTPGQEFDSPVVRTALATVIAVRSIRS